MAYPSGWANGYVTFDHPEYKGMNLAYVFARVKAGEKAELCLPTKGYAILSACTVDETDFHMISRLPVPDREKVTYQAEADTTVMAFYLRQNNPGHIRSWKWQDLPYGFREHPDFLSSAAMDRYVEGALAPILPHIKPGTLDAVFTDEPALNCFYLGFDGIEAGFDSIPWTPGFSELYEKTYHESLLDRLPEVFLGTGDEAERTRIRFYGLISDLMYRNFTKKAGDYCKQFGVKYSGHFLLEEGLPYHVAYYGDYMKVMNGLGIPGCDILQSDAAKFFDLGSAWSCNWSFSAKFASSLSRMQGHNTTMLELCPFTDPTLFNQDPFKQRMALCTYAIFTGCTRLNSYGWESGDDEHKQRWNEYCGRILQNLREADSDSRIAIFYPICDAQAKQKQTSLTSDTLIPEAWSFNSILEKLALTIYNEKEDFNMITEEAILNAEIKDGRLIAGGLSVSTVILPAMTFLSRKAAEKLNDFVRAGGRVLCHERRPDKGLERNESVADLTGSFPVFTDFAGLLTDPDALPVAGEAIYRGGYRRDGERMDLLVNRDAENDHIAAIGGTGFLTVFDPETAETKELPLPCTLTVRAGRALLAAKSR